MVILTPAYGRDYTNQEKLLQDFKANKDFILHDLNSRWDGKPCNLSDLQSVGSYNDIKFRYDKLTKGFIINLDELETN